MLKRRIKGSSLLLAMVVSLLIVMTLLAFMMLYEYNRYFLFEGNKSSELIHNINSARNLLEMHPNEFPFGTKTLDLFGQEKDSVAIERKEWGLLDSWFLTAFTGRHTLQKAYLSGEHPGGDSLALYLAGNNRPLSLCGKTLIRGDVKLSKQGVKRAYIEGQNFVGTRLVHGVVGQSTTALPELNEDLDGRIKSWSGGSFNEVNTLQHLNELNAIKGKADSCLLVRAKQEVVLSGGQDLAWTIIYSGTKIKVGNCSMENCILVAPEIEIFTPFRGSVQCFATRKVNIGEGVRLDYPSNIVLSTTAAKSEVNIKESATVDGGILVIMQNKFPQKNWARLNLEKKSLVRGRVYVDGIVQQKGNIIGSLTTRLFYLKTPSSVYENHLLNVSIDRSLLPHNYIATYSGQLDAKIGIIECLK